MPSSGTTVSLLRTKLHRPPVPRDYVERGRLGRELLTAHAFTLVSAAAGYGKSTLVSARLDHWGGPSAWVSLDESDNDLRQFLGYVCEAVETLFPSSLPEIAGLLEAPTLPPVTVLAPTLINELDAIEEPLVLVLDDVHRIRERAVFDLLTEVMEHPPRHLHFVLVGRRDPFLPIARLRARHLLSEVRSEDLSFSVEETKAFLENALQTQISAAVAGAWQEGTEGWATGLRLAALALRGGSEVPERPFEQRKSVRDATQYLVGEVLEHQPPEVRDHLLRSSIVDRFCASLCDALAEPEGSGARGAGVMDGAVFVESLEEAGLFVIPLDAERGWFRYHHLFRDLLREECERHLEADAIAALHARASEWFEAEGLITEAIDQALKAEDVERAAGIVERNRLLALESDRWSFLEKWLSQLPEAVVHDRPELLVARAWVLYFRFRIERIPPVLDSAAALLVNEAENSSLRGEISFFRAIIDFFTGNDVASLRDVESALDLIPASASMIRGEAEVILILATQMVEGSRPANRVAVDLLSSQPPPTPLRMTRLLAGRVFAEIISGELASAEGHNRRLVTTCTGGGFGHALAWATYLQGLIHLQRFELEEAVRTLTRAAEQRYIFDARGAADSVAGLVYASHAIGRPEDARSALKLLRDFADQLGDPEYQDIAASCAARLSLMEGRFESANSWLATKPSTSAEVMIFWLEVPCVTRCRALIAEGSAGSLREAAGRLAEYAALSEAQHNTFQLIHIRTLEALTLEKQGRSADALMALEEAVRLAQPGGFIFPFVEPGADIRRLLGRLRPQGEEQAFVSRILAAFEELDAAASAENPAAEPRPADDSSTGRLSPDLTSREMDVLELLAERLQDKEIAARLYVTTHTVNHHLKHIYRKLGVTQRRKAVERAIELGLLERIPSA